jgi:hypothetical protein
VCRSAPEYVAALKAFPFHSGVPLAEYERDIVHDHILQRGGALRALINAGTHNESRAQITKTTDNGSDPNARAKQSTQD